MGYLNPHTHQLDTPARPDSDPTCVECGQPATTQDGIIGANLCNNDACLTAAYDRAWPAQSWPRIVVLCGSTRFRDEFYQANENLTMQGCIVLMPGVFSHATGRVITDEQKAMLDHLHLRKIDLADEVVVVSDASGYYGESTRREIAYAEQAGKPIHYLTGTSMTVRCETSGIGHHTAATVRIDGSPRCNSCADVMDPNGSRREPIGVVPA